MQIPEFLIWCGILLVPLLVAAAIADWQEANHPIKKKKAGSWHFTAREKTSITKKYTTDRQNLSIRRVQDE